MNICPNCGYRHTREDYAPELASVRLPRRERDLILRLSQAHGSLVHTSNLVDFIYQDEEDGGPLTADRTIHVHVTKARQRIKPHGWTIEEERYRGYKLVRLS